MCSIIIGDDVDSGDGYGGSNGDDSDDGDEGDDGDDGDNEDGEYKEVVVLIPTTCVKVAQALITPHHCVRPIGK